MNLRRKDYDSANRHIDTTYVLLLECIEKESIQIDYVATNIMKTVGMTKSLKEVKHEAFVLDRGLRKMNLIKLEQRTFPSLSKRV